jgi:hypothetical protein
MGFSPNEFRELIASKIQSQVPTLRIVILCFAVLIGAIVLLFIIDKLFYMALSRSYIDQIALAFNLNRHLADAIALGVFVLLVFFSSRLFSLSSVKRRIGFLGIVALLIANSIALWQGTKNQFFEASGAATKCYVLTREGVRYGERPGTDPTTGKQCRPVTVDMIERLEAYAHGKRPERVAANDPVFFDLKTGEPVIWFAKNKSGEIELFDLMGFHPGTGEELMQINREVVEEWKNQQHAIAERAPIKINPDQFVFFDPKTGEPRAWYWRRPDGEFEFYDNKGFQPLTGQPLVVVTREVVEQWRTQVSKKCYIVTRETVRFGTEPGIDPETGRECRLLSPGLLERLREYEKGNRPKRVTAQNPVFFDLRTGEPILWYVKDEKGHVQLFDLMGFDPESGHELLPVTQEIASSWKHQVDLMSRKPPQLVDPNKYAFFDQVTGDPRVWYWRSPNGDWEFYDNPGFRGTGEKLNLISPEVIETWKRDQADRAKRAEAEALAQRQREIAEAQKAAAAAEAQKQHESAEAERAAAEAQAGELCDQAAANPTDGRRPSSVPGVEYFDLKPNAKAAVEVCAQAVRRYPGELRYKYNLARALEFVNPGQALALDAELAQARYVAAYDNYGGLLLRERNLPAAIRQYEIGVRLGDPSAMVSIAYLIYKNQYHVSDPDRVRRTLLTKAAQAGHKGAQDTLERERAEFEEKAAQRQTQQQQQQMMMQLFGTVLRGVAR